MKFNLGLIAVLVIGLPVAVSAFEKTREAKTVLQKIEQTIEADPAIDVSLCILSGSVTVRGWNNNQVLARSAEATRIDFNRNDGSAQTAPARKIEIAVIDGDNRHGGCQAFSDVEISVPRGATIHVQTRDGDITIADVAEAYAVSQNGEIYIQGASRSAEVCSVAGSVTIRDSVGRVNLSSVG